MPPRRRLSKRQFERWYFQRFDTLVNEGFTPDEAGYLSSMRISTPVMRRLRRIRKRRLQRIVDRGYSHSDALRIMRQELDKTEEEIVTFQDFVNVAYFRVGR